MPSLTRTAISIFPEIADQLDAVFALMRENEVERALCVSVTLEDFPRVRGIAET